MLMEPEERERLLKADVPTVERELSGALNALVSVYREAQAKMHPDTPAHKWCETKVGALRDFANSAPGRREWIVATVEMAQIEVALAESFVAKASETYGFTEATPEPQQEPAAKSDVVAPPAPPSAAPAPASAPERAPVRDSLFVVVKRSEVESGNAERVLSLLHALTDTPEIARRAQGTVGLRFDGFEEEADELFEIDAVRNYVGKLDDGFPYWLFFGDTRTMSLQTITQCFLPKFLTMDEQIEQIPRELNELLTNRWVPAMKYIAEYAKFGEDEITALHITALNYYLKTPGQLRD